MRAYIALGSNLGDREQNINAAVERLRQTAGIRVEKVSSYYETEPVGGPPQGKYLNAVVEVECCVSASGLLKQLQRIEKDLGRTRPGKSFPRTIDLDILLFGDQVIDEAEIKVPHPRMHVRLFVLDPLSEIAPEAVHPVLGQTVAEMRQSLREADASR